MDGGAPVTHYQWLATFRDGVVEWRLGVQTSAGQHLIPIRDGEEVPVLLDILRQDATVYFDAENGTLRTGWSTPGEGRPR